MRPEARPEAPPAAEPELLDAAAVIGRRLCRDALWSGRRCNWLGERMDPHDGEWRVVLAAGGCDLYAGTAGLALFLARLWSFTGEGLVRETARAALRQARSRAADLEGPGALGFHAGLSGVAWAAAQIAEALDDAEADETAGELAARLSQLRPSPGALDVIGGSAGAIPACLDLAERLGRSDPADRLRDQAVRCGDHLLANAREDDDGGVSWDTLGGGSPRPLTGFGHGAAGIAWALSELAAATGEERFARAAAAGVRYERACFDPHRGNWPDFRDQGSLQGASRRRAGEAEAGPSFAMAWCHGAPGIGLGRLRGWQLTGDGSLLDEGRIALETTREALAHPALGNFSLCHGHGGNAELAVFAAGVLEDPEPLESARSVGRAGIELYHRTRSPWPCGVPEAGETPGLMTGLAGVGYFYLRLYDPAAVTPVLIPVPRQG